MRKITSGNREIKGMSTYPKDPLREERTEQLVSAHHVSGAIGCTQATLLVTVLETFRAAKLTSLPSGKETTAE